jgi:SAM-dependent methyltransferase
MSLSGVAPISGGVDPVSRIPGRSRPSFQPTLPRIQENDSPYRRVFQTTAEMKEEFGKFLETIFYQLDKEIVFKKMEEILSDPNKTDEAIYQEILSSVQEMKKSFTPLRQMYALSVLRDGMGKQAATFLAPFKKEGMRDFAEIYDRRYLNAIRREAGCALDGRTYAVCDFPKQEISLLDRVQAGALFGRYPYQAFVGLNDEDCEDPILQPEKTCRPLGDSIENGSLDMISCLGGLHHVPDDRLEPFIESMYQKMRPGAVLLFRDHDIDGGVVDKEELIAIASVVHSFVNAADEVSGEAERKEIREFKPMKDWIKLLKGFTPLTEDGYVLKDDPTENKMMAFVKTPKNLEELKQAVDYRADYDRPKDDSFATWIEWGNVRLSKEYASFIQNHHANAFDYIGSIRQHWQFFYQYVSENLDQKIKLTEFIFSDNFVMNLFILFTALLSNISGYVSTAPSRLFAMWKHGDNWREVVQLSTVEKIQAKVELEYSNFIDEIPFYGFPFLKKIQELWLAIHQSNDSIFRKTIDGFQAIFYSVELLTKSAIAAVARFVYDNGQDAEPQSVKLIIQDPFDRLNRVIEQFDQLKGEKAKNQVIRKIYETEDKAFKFIQVPRYKPFTEIMKLFAQEGITALTISNREKISVDLRLDSDEEVPTFEGIAKKSYTMTDLHSSNGKVHQYATYVLNIQDLNQFIQQAGQENIHYIHE